MRIVVTGATGNVGTGVLAALGADDRVEGMREPAGLPTPPPDPHAGGALRIRELLTGVGRRT